MALYAVYCPLALFVLGLAAERLLVEDVHYYWWAYPVFLVIGLTAAPGVIQALRILLARTATDRAQRSFLFRMLLISVAGGAVLALAGGLTESVGAPLPSTARLCVWFLAALTWSIFQPPVHLRRRWSARYILAAMLLTRLRSYGTALVLLDRHLANHPGNRQAIFMRWHIHVLQKRPLEAFEELQRLPCGHPDTQLLARRGPLLRVLGALPECVDDLALLLSLEPKAPRHLLIASLLNLERSDDAMRQIELLPEAERESPYTLCLKAEALQLKGETEDADALRRCVLQRLREDGPRANPAVEIDILVHLGRFGEARESLARMSSTDHEVMAIYIDVHDGRPGAARERAERLLASAEWRAFGGILQDPSTRTKALAAPEMEALVGVVQERQALDLDRVRAALAGWRRWPLPVRQEG